MKTRVLIFNSMVCSRLTYSCQTWNISIAEMNKINSVYIGILRKLVRNGLRVPVSHDEHFTYLPNRWYWNFRFKTTIQLPRTYMARQSNQCLTNRLIFNANIRIKIGRPTETLEDKVMKSSGLTKDAFYKEALMENGSSTQTNHRQLSNW